MKYEEDFRNWIAVTSARYEREYRALEETLRDAIYDWSADVFHLSSAPLSGWIWIRCRW